MSRVQTNSDASVQWHQLDVAAAMHTLESRVDGLTDEEARRRLAEYGPNQLIESDRRSPLVILWDQLRGALVLLLLVAAAVSAYLTAYTDAAVILAIVVLNGALGFFQDYRAERALLALRRLAVPHVHVRRGGTIRVLSARQVVPGDIVLLEAGNVVPADARVLETQQLRALESALTGESSTVDKTRGALAIGDVSLGDRHNMVYMGTEITHGRGEVLVTATGMHAELGRIAGMLHTVRRKPTPLQRRLTQLGRGLALAALVVVAIVFAVGIARGEPVRLMFLTALSLAVAAVPEGLPAVTTVALALGARTMLARKALIRKLPAVETLGSVTVICADKTGTLTENRMTVSDYYLPHVANVAPTPQVEPALQEPGDAAALLWSACALCHDAREQVDTDGDVTITGDPTDVAIATAAANAGFAQTSLEQSLPRVGEFPFDSDRKRMTTVHRVVSPGPATAVPVSIVQRAAGAERFHSIAFSKGAVDSLLHVCNRVWHGDRPAALDESWRQRIIEAQEAFAQRGMRVIGVAIRPMLRHSTDATIDDIEHDFTFVGLVGIADPLRPEVRRAVDTCKAAGIRPVMITGDHPATALQIAKRLGIGDVSPLRGDELAAISPAALRDVVDNTTVYARVTPQHKLQIVRALQERGHVVAMTGDGVNDAPALKKADIGVAMGITGTDVAKEAADMVLLNDNFATIVNAVATGRNVYDNIRKFVRYTLTSNAGEIWVMLLAPLVGMPLPLLPLQILWINLVTDGLPGLALAIERAERNTMERPPYPPSESIFGRGLAREILLVGLFMGLLSLGSGFWYWKQQGIDEAHWRTVIFTVLTLSQLGNALAVRSARDSLFTIGILSNKLMIASIGATFALQIGVIYLPFFQTLLSTSALPAQDLALCLVLGVMTFIVVETMKGFRRRADR